MGVLALFSSCLSGTALGKEPIQPTEPTVFRDTAVDLLDVADAFDDRDAFDLNLRLSFDHQSRSAPIRRETSIQQPGLTTGGYLSDLLDVATYSESTERLIPEIDIGLLPEFALKLRLPVILAHNRKLSERGNADPSIVASGLPGEQLFSIPFASPTRSGIEYFAVGLDLGIMNQARNPHQPNWVVGMEGRFNVSEAMHACNADAEIACAYPADINRNGENDVLGPSYGSIATTREGNFDGARQAGVSRGTTAFEVHAFVSRRYKYVEPYSGVSALFEFPLTSSDYGEVDLEGALVNHPPLRGTITMGMAVIPWEQPEKFQRLSIDFRARGTYVSEGRDYSELFDALGSSTAGSLRAANFSDYKANTLANDQIDAFSPSVVDPESRRVYMTGLTDVQQHGDYDFRTTVSYQAGEYVRFDLGGALRVIEAHYLTFDQACNPNLSFDVTRSGPCKVPVGLTGEGAVDPAGDPVPEGVPLWQFAGLPNANYRRVINEPGRRFKADTSIGLGAFIRASVLF